MTNHPEMQHINIISDILTNGAQMNGRNGPYRSLFMRSMTFDISPNDAGEVPIPVSTVAGTYLKGVIAEFESFFIRGESDSKILEEKGVNVWRDNTVDTDGKIGPAYGHNYRNYGGTYDSYGNNRDGVDQVSRLIAEAAANPYSRRLIILNTDPRVNDECVLHPCQMMFQVYLAPAADEGSFYLDLMAHNRSSDITCAGMWNSAFAAMVAVYLAKKISEAGNMKVMTRTLHVSLGNVHVYENQVSTAVEHISRKPTGSFPRIIINDDDRVVVTKPTKTEYSGLRYILNP